MSQQNNETSIYLYHSNQFIDLLNPKVEDIDIRDIARGLAFECRYNGQIKRFWSVISHSILVCGFAPKELKLEGLLHDAEEAYIKDNTSPLIKAIRQITIDVFKTTTIVPSPYDIVKNKFKERIIERFNLSYLEQDWKVIKEIDNRVCATESLQLRNIPYDGDFLPYNGIYIPEWTFGESIEKFLALYERYKRD